MPMLTPISTLAIAEVETPTATAPTANETLEKSDFTVTPFEYVAWLDGTIARGVR